MEKKFGSKKFYKWQLRDSFSKQNIRVVNPADQTDVGFIDEALDDEIEFAFDAASQAHQKSSSRHGFLKKVFLFKVNCRKTTTL